MRPVCAQRAPPLSPRRCIHPLSALVFPPLPVAGPRWYRARRSYRGAEARGAQGPGPQRPSAPAHSPTHRPSALGARRSHGVEAPASSPRAQKVYYLPGTKHIATAQHTTALKQSSQTKHAACPSPSLAPGACRLSAVSCQLSACQTLHGLDTRYPPRLSACRLVARRSSAVGSLIPAPCSLLLARASSARLEPRASSLSSFPLPYRRPSDRVTRSHVSRKARSAVGHVLATTNVESGEWRVEIKPIRRSQVPGSQDPRSQDPK